MRTNLLLLLLRWATAVQLLPRLIDGRAIHLRGQRHVFGALEPPLDLQRGDASTHKLLHLIEGRQILRAQQVPGNRVENVQK